VSDLDQVSAVTLLLAARDILRDTLAADKARAVVAAQIDRFINHEPVDVAAVAAAVGMPFGRRVEGNG
jgi:hypothetical protein